MFNLVL